MADIKTQILLELGIKGDTNVATRINKIIESQFKLGDTAKATEAQQASLADAFKKTDFALRGLGKGAKDAGIDSDILSQALKGNKIAIGQVKRELAISLRAFSTAVFPLTFRSNKICCVILAIFFWFLVVH